jgi:TSS9, PorZ, N-terminal beta-propeller domain/Two component regulator propeller
MIIAISLEALDLPVRSAIQLLLAFCFLTSRSTAQSNIPVGQWRTHISYNSINGIAIGDSKVYAAASVGLMVLDEQDKSIVSYSKLNGLSEGTIRYLNVDETSGDVFLAYDDGALDIIQGNTILNYSRLKDTPITGPKKINHVAFNENLAYLSADYGVVVFDTKKLEVKETWRDLGAGGIPLAINQSTILGDTVFLASENGVIAGDLKDNLLDFASWKRYDQNELRGPVHAISTFDGKVYAAVDNVGLFRFENGIITKEVFLQNVVFQSLNASADHLVICEKNHLWLLSKTGVLTESLSPLITGLQFAVEDSQGITWAGDEKNGLLSINGGTGSNYIANGPAFNTPFRLTFSGGQLYAIEGGYSSNFISLGNEGNVSIFSEGRWISETSPLKDLTDLTFVGDVVFLSSFGQGVQSGKVGSPDIIYNETNSTLINSSPPGNFVDITALAGATEGLWVANYDVSSSLHWFSNGSWQDYAFPFSAAHFPVSLSVDYTGSVWATLNPSEGGGILVFNKEENKAAYLTEEAGAGGLPDRNVYCLSSDRDGSMWIGTEKGVAYMLNPAAVFGTGVNAVRPIFENRFLLSDEKITAIAVDGGNRKWIGTERGAWLFGPSGDELVYNFTTDNSPLLSNVIRDIAIDPEDGEVFFATDGGIVSFRSDATVSNGDYTSVKVFPNPVTIEFNGLVGISGLATDAIVKITDSGGKLVWQTRANGGTATWNVRNYHGRRATTGIYLIFSATSDGSQHYVGKIAVIE